VAPPTTPTTCAASTSANCSTRTSSASGSSRPHPWAIAGAALAGPAIGAAGFTTGLLIGLVVVFTLADSRSEEATFQAYGNQRDLAVYGGCARRRWSRQIA
jgi:hypothetical protein